MGMDSDFGGSGAWAGAGLAFGVGLIEGQTEERRHREVLRALATTRNTEAYIADLQNANVEAEVLLLQTRFRSVTKDKQIDRLNSMITNYKAVDVDRVEVITRLRDTLVKFDASNQRLAATKDELITAQESLLAKKDKLITTMKAAALDTGKVLATLTAQIGALKSDVAGLEKLVALHSRRAERLTKLFDNENRSGRRWRDQCAAIQNERDEYLKRLVRIGQGETMLDPAAPAATHLG